MRFRDEYAFLSNMYPCTVECGEYVFASVEAAFQACKCPARAGEFTRLNGPDAKRLGRKVSLPADWNLRKRGYMKQLLRKKFTQHPELAEKLLATGDIELVEENTWGDRYWGVCGGAGENNLGKLLMEIRSELRH